MFKAKEIGKIFGNTRILHNISFEISHGERVALVGASGVGKTTLLRILSGSVIPSSGCLCLDGLEVSGPGKTPHQELRKRAAMIYQSKNLVPSLTVLHNILIGELNRYSPFKGLLSMIWPLEKDKVLRALERVGLPHKLTARASRLSGGEMQRVALARLIIRDPEIFLADEPVSSLDISSGDDLMRLITELARELGKTLIVSTHNIAHVKTYFNRVIGLRNGAIMFDLPCEKITDSLWAELNKEAEPLPFDNELLLPAKISKRSLCGTEIKSQKDKTHIKSHRSGETI